MLQFVLHKLVSKKWLALCLLIGNILMVAVASSNPLYTDAILQRALTRHLGTTVTQENLHPAELRFTRNSEYTKGTREEYNAELASVAGIPDVLELPVVLHLEEHTYKVSQTVQLGLRSDGRSRALTFSSLSDFKSHTRIVAGSYMADSVTDGVIEAVVSQVLQREYNYLVGDEYELTSLLQPNGKPYILKIVGIYAASQSADIYWNSRSTKLSSHPVISEAVYASLFASQDTSCRHSYFLDFTAVSPKNMDTAISLLDSYTQKHKDNAYGYYSENLSQQLEAFLPEATQFKATLLVLYAPIFALLAAFIFMVSQQMMDLEENEIAVIVSRGSKKSQIVTIYFLQAAILAALGCLLGYPLGFFLCQMLGSANSFLEFVQRQALPLTLSWNSLGFAAGAALVSCGFMTLPVLRYAGRSIVQYKVQKQSQNTAPLWQKLFLDVILLGVSLYALYSFNNQKAYLAQQVLLYGSLDPLLYFSSSIFIVGAGLLGIRLVPYVIRLVYTLGKRIWSPAMYTACLRVIRTKNQQTFIMLFLILTIALGIFNAASARTINTNGESRITYLGGADVVLQEKWTPKDESGTRYFEPNYEVYKEIVGAESMTKVYLTDDAPVLGNADTSQKATLMGIQTKEFGTTANFDTTLLPTHWFHYLNAMAQDPNGVLVSSNFRDDLGYQLGDTIRYQDSGSYGVDLSGHGNSYSTAGSKPTLTGTIYGFVDYWPGFSPSKTEISASGEILQSDNYLIVASLAQLQMTMGVKPYQVWLNMGSSTQGVYDFIADRDIPVALFRDTSADLIAMKNEPLFQGTSGILTANFIVVLLLCSVGFLIYWILSIRSRELQFGIFRAMGLSMGEVIRMLAVEQLLISGTSIALGVGIGILVTQLYLPLVQIAYSGAQQVLPMRLVTEAGDYIRLFAVIGFMVICCMAILAWLISKIRIAQALKLGED